MSTLIWLVYSEKIVIFKVKLLNFPGNFDVTVKHKQVHKYVNFPVDKHFCRSVCFSKIVCKYNTLNFFHSFLYMHDEWIIGRIRVAFSLGLNFLNKNKILSFSNFCAIFRWKKLDILKLIIVHLLIFMQKKIQLKLDI